MKTFAAAAAFSLLLVSGAAFATMEAAYTTDPSGEGVHHRRPACPDFIFIEHKDGSMEEHVSAHKVIEGRSAVDSGECVFY
ncbi:MAG: hypothetical protein SPL30_09675 [Succinivibrio sp.]|jgi:hypothetical protein|nr:hypothetical protein [Succinivibrio sp.]